MYLEERNITRVRIDKGLSYREAKAQLQLRTDKGSYAGIAQLNTNHNLGEIVGNIVAEQLKKYIGGSFDKSTYPQMAEGTSQQANNDELLQRLQAMEAMYTANSAEIAHLGTDMNQMREENNRLKNNNKQLEKQIEQLKKDGSEENARLKAENAKLTEQIKLLEKEKETTQGKNKISKEDNRPRSLTRNSRHSSLQRQPETKNTTPQTSGKHYSTHSNANKEITETMDYTPDTSGNKRQLERTDSAESNSNPPPQKTRPPIAERTRSHANLEGLSSEDSS